MCGTEKPYSEFYSRKRVDKYPKSNAGYSPQCKFCIREKQKIYRAKLTEDERRSIDLRHFFGIDAKRWNEMFTEQNGKCAVCEIHQSEMGRRFHVDHNHTTGEVRGLLCSNCNTGIGKLQESERIFSRAMNYLRKYRSGSADITTGIINLELVKKEG